MQKVHLLGPWALPQTPLVKSWAAGVACMGPVWAPARGQPGVSTLPQARCAELYP